MRTYLAANLLYYPATRLGGEPVRRMLAEYRRHGEMSADALANLQTRHLADILNYARDHVPRYSSLISDESTVRQSPKEVLGRIPLLEKNQLRSDSTDIRSSERFWRVEEKTTSGSTGHPVTVWKNREALARERGATWRAYEWAGISVAAPQALLWGRSLTISGRVKSEVLDFLANRMRLPMFGVTESVFERYAKAMNRFRPKYLYGYVSGIKSFVTFLDSTGRQLPDSVTCIVTTSELLDAATRQYISERTGLPVFNEYGCGEVGSIAHDCELGHLHIMSDNLLLESIPSPGLPDGFGELVVTDLFNKAMPLIRYRLGDLGVVSSTACDCGRPFPVLDRLVGRAYDTIHDADGRAFHPEAILYVFEELRRSGLFLPAYQAIQRRAGTLDITIETGVPLDKDVAALIESQLRLAFKNRMDARVSSIPHLAREPSGKLRVVKRESPP